MGAIKSAPDAVVREVGRVTAAQARGGGCGNGRGCNAPYKSSENVN